MSSDKPKFPTSDIELEKTARYFQMLSEVTRLKILYQLQSGPKFVGELVEAIGCSQGNISRQLDYLLREGILKREKQGVKALYSVADDVIMGLCKLVCARRLRQN